MSTLPGYGRINWAIYSPSHKLNCVATPKGVWSVRHEGESSVFLVKEDDGDDDRHEVDELQLGDWAFYEGDNPRQKNRFRLWVRPGFNLKITGYAPDKKREEITLRFGRGSHRFLSELPPRKRVDIPRSQWAKALASAGMRLTKTPPRNLPGNSFAITECDEYEEGRLIYNEISGYWQREPDGDRALDDGLYWSERYSQWMGAATSEKLPEVELKLFFAALKPEQRLLIARRLDSDAFDVRPIPAYYSGEGLEFLKDHLQIDYTRNTRRNFEDERITTVFEEAIDYLCTLRPGVTKDATKQVLSLLQDVEVGLARRSLIKEKIDGHDIVSAGGRQSISGQNHGTRLIGLLKVGRMQSFTRAAFQRRWNKVASSLTWEALELKVLAGDFGIAPYPSREWISDLINKQRKQQTADTKQRIEYQQRAAQEAAERAERIAARREDDIFAIVKAQAKGYLQLQVIRSGAIRETHTVCAEGTRLFCNKTGLSQKRRYTRLQIRERISQILRENTGQNWLNSHNFQWLFSEIGVSAPAQAA